MRPLQPQNIMDSEHIIQLPSVHVLRLAVELYLKHAYGEAGPPNAVRFLPPEECDVQAWLMSDAIERDPPSAPLEAVRSFALRIGNMMYPHMKLRLSRPPRDRTFLFTVDCHDAFLFAKPDSLDYKPLEELKKYNASLATAIHSDWDHAGLPTEHNYLRAKIAAARAMENR